jgi:hypothetical protein
MMALTHHFLVHTASSKTRKSPKGKYVLLGDDIVIFDSDLASAYQQVLEELDMPISKMKTHVSKDTCEFAKR